jgi:pimeloyl-ACP methyl ester carboxylesterase
VTRAGRCSLIAALSLCGGCAGVQARDAFAPPVCCNAGCADPRGMVFAADGAGNFQASSAALRRVIDEQGLPLCVERVEWSHGYGRILADHLGRGHVAEEGEQLAARVRAYSLQAPGKPVYLVGHSDGCAVVLAAAEALPPGGVERIILLAPAVSSCYDLRPALACARGGVDVFYSERDWAFLGVGVALLGTADGRTDDAAGRVGFKPVGDGPADACLYAKLRQHPWDCCQVWTGNRGGHYGGYQPVFLRTQVVPLLMAR